MNCFAKWQHNTILAPKMIAKNGLTGVKASLRRNSSYETCINILFTQDEIMRAEPLLKELGINGGSDEHR